MSDDNIGCIECCIRNNKSRINSEAREKLDHIKSLQNKYLDIDVDDRNECLGDLVNALKTQFRDNPNFDDLDALETYGPDQNDDANRASYMGDPGGFSVWDWNGGAPAGWFPKADIVAAIATLGWSGDEESVDIDALMTSSDEIIFSIRANGNWDGGELVVMTLGNPRGAAFLNHGMHLWNTAFNVQAAFGVNT